MIKKHLKFLLISGLSLSSLLAMTAVGAGTKNQTLALRVTESGSSNSDLAKEVKSKTCFETTDIGDAYCPDTQGNRTLRVIFAPKNWYLVEKFTKDSKNKSIANRSVVYQNDCATYFKATQRTPDEDGTLTVRVTGTAIKNTDGTEKITYSNCSQQWEKQ